MKKPIVIIGAGGLGREILSFLNALPEWEPQGFLDDYIQKSYCVSGLPIIGSIDDAKIKIKKNTAAVIAIGDPQVKQSVETRLENAQLHFPTLIHPRAVLMSKDTCTIMSGTIIGAGCILTTAISIGKHVLININTTVGHDVRIGDYSSVMPGVNIAGDVKVGSLAFIGAGSNIRNGLVIGNKSTIAMGAAVIQDVAPGQTVVGVPAKSIRK